MILTISIFVFPQTALALEGFLLPLYRIGLPCHDFPTISSNTSVAGSSPPGWAPQRKGAVQSEGDLGMKVQHAWHVWLP